MEKYIIKETKSTPFVDFSFEENKLSFKGESYPENAYGFYEPIYEVLDKYLELNSEEVFTVDFQLSYINTSSIKCLILLFDKLNKNYQEGKNIIINWYYDEENGFDYDMGQDFQMGIDISFNFISISDEE
jgi:hypothetical protein